MKLTTPAVLSLNAGYVDTAGFLALQGLFTAHVTGNFVTLGAALVNGTTGVVAKLLALPVFCLMVILTRLFSSGIARWTGGAWRVLVVIKALLLAAGAWLAIKLGPFPNGDSLAAIATGMVLVCAMAIQNALNRIHLSSSPPSTLMTGTTTQVMLDIADLLHGGAPDALLAARARLEKMVPNLAGFAIGCTLGAILFATTGGWCFVIPPVVGLMPLFLRDG